jgi:hypothetical protein
MTRAEPWQRFEAKVDPERTRWPRVSARDGRRSPIAPTGAPTPGRQRRRGQRRRLGLRRRCVGDSPQVEAAGPVEQFLDDHDQPAMRLTPEGLSVGRQLAMLGEDGQDDLMAALLGEDG